VGRRVAIIIVLAIVAVLSTIAIACNGIISGSGKLETKEMSYTDFTGLEVGSAFEVDITRADSYQVEITVDDNLLNYLDIHQSGKILRIGLKQPYVYPRTTQRATVTMPALTELELSGASKGRLTGFNSANPVEFRVSGASSLRIADFKAGETEFDVSGASRVSGNVQVTDGKFDVSGASNIELEGSAEDISIDVSGASRANLDDFTVANADVELSGASSATVNSSGKLDATVSGASTLYYLGNPTLGRIEVTGASTLKKR
jgi:hypothetical protein